MISISGGLQPRWRDDGKELFYYSLDNKLMSVDVNTNANNFEAGTPKVLFEARLVPGQPTGAGAYSVTRDGQRFLTNLLAEDSSPSPAVVVQNWTASLRK